MKRYPEYKDSGIEWLKDIPSHWKINKFGRVSYMKGRIGWQGLKQSEFVDDPSLPYLITGMNFKNGVINWEEVYHISEERYAEAPEIQLQEDDVLMTKDGTIGKLLYVDHLPNKTSLNSHLLVLRPLKGGYIPRFIYYELQSEHFKHHVEHVKVGTTFYGITQEGTGQFMVILPPNSEQYKIATFLDHKTRQIDDLIAKKQKLIELLQEERTALINQAVTKGLDPTVPMKDSGIEWLGEIPEHWKIIKLKFIGNAIIGLTYSPADITEDESNSTLVLRASNIQNGKLNMGDKVFVSKRIPDVLKTKIGDILICSRSGSKALIGKNICIDQISEGLTFGAFMAVFRTPYWMFISKVLNSTIFTSQSELYLTVTINQLTNDTLNNLLIAFPNTEEERINISNYIDYKTNLIDEQMHKVEREIELISEYKTSLINEAVTGKIDVRDNQINRA